MPISVQPLVIPYSFAAHVKQAQDAVSAVQLDAVFKTINDKLTEIINAVNTIQRDDDHLSDQAIDFRALNDDVVAEIASRVNTAVAAATA